MATETPGMVCGPTTGCGQTTPMVPTRIHTVNGIEKGWQAPAACSRCGKPFGFFSLINNPPPIAPRSPWFVFASSLGEPVSQEAPDVDRQLVCCFCYRGMADGVEHFAMSGVSKLALCDKCARSAFSGIPRTENEPEECPRCSRPVIVDLAAWMYDSDEELDEMCQCPPVISSASPLSEDSKRLDFLQAWCDDMFWTRDRNPVGEPRLTLSWFIGDGGSPAFDTTGDDWRDAIDQARVKMGDIDRLSASAPSPE